MVLSFDVSFFVVDGQSNSMNFAKTPTATVRIPSMMKIL